MPIFLDRHDIKGVTAVQIAEAHLQDLALQDQFGVKFLTYWFDQERGIAFCLIDAPSRDIAQQVHDKAHALMAGEVIEVALSSVEAFLGRVSDPNSAVSSPRVGIEPGHRTIMFTDIVGSAEMTTRLGDVLAAELVRAHDSLLRRSLAKHSGREVKHLGDGIMASFESALAAVDCSRMMQKLFENYNISSANPIHIRIGLHSGEPVEDNNDLFGSAVQIASRLCDLAEADQILTSGAVKQETANGSGFCYMGPKVFRGFEHPIEVFECDWRHALVDRR
jgi:class 3 adenylate cyclase